MKSKIDIANDILSRQLSWISSSDNKVPAIFAINTAMLGVVAALLNSFENWSKLNSILITILLIFLLGSVVCLAVATFPRLNGPKGSLIYFGGIVTRSLEQYKTEIQNLSDDKLIVEILTQVYRNAEIATNKFLWVKISMILTFFSFPFWLITVWLIS